MIRHHGYRRQRLAQTSNLLRERIFTGAVSPESILVAGPVGRISWEEAQGLDYRPLEPGERFGTQWATWWFRIEALPPQGPGRPFLRWELGGDGTGPPGSPPPCVRPS